MLSNGPSPRLWARVIIERRRVEIGLFVILMTDVLLKAPTSAILNLLLVAPCSTAPHRSLSGNGRGGVLHLWQRPLDLWYLVIRVFTALRRSIGTNEAAPAEAAATSMRFHLLLGTLLATWRCGTTRGDIDVVTMSLFGANPLYTVG